MLKTSHKWATAAVVAGAFVLGATAQVRAEVQSLNIKAVGTWANLTNYYDFEKPFYGGDLQKASGGKINSTVNPITELGLKGWEVMRLLKLGVFDVAHGVYGYVASENPALEGVDLSGAAGDFKQAREIVKAYEPVIAKHFDKTFSAKYLGTFRWPSQFIFCNQPVTKVTDLKGKKIRVYSTTLGDFVEGVGGTSVTIAFAEVVPALQKGVADCGITGSMPAYQAKWHEVITHAMVMPVGAGLGFVAMSNKMWKSLNKETQNFLQKQYDDLTERQWANAQKEDEEALNCLSGNGPCGKGDAGTVKLTKPSANDFKEREEWDRDAYWWFKLPGSGLQFRIPKPFEVGALGTLAERLVEQVVDDEVHGELFAERLAHMLKETFAFSAVPQLFQPMLDIYSNKDPFTKRPIESMSMERLSPTERRSVWTSQTAIAASVAMDKISWGKVVLSPVQVEYIVRGYLGWIGSTSLGVMDMVSRPLAGAPGRPSWQIQDYPVVGRFVRENPTKHSKYVTLFYEQLKEIQQAAADINAAKRLQDFGKAQSLREKHKDLLKDKTSYTRTQRQMNQLSNRMKILQKDRAMDSDAKRRKLDELTTQRNQLARRIVELRQ